MIQTENHVQQCFVNLNWSVSPMTEFPAVQIDLTSIINCESDTGIEKVNRNFYFVYHAIVGSIRDICNVDTI